MTHKEKRTAILERDQYKCVWCGIGNTYNNRPLNLQIDHIDGNRKNNHNDNLRTLCPNCHSQTETYTFNKTKSKFENKLKNFLSNKSKKDVEEFFIKYSYEEIVNITGTSLRTIRKYVKENNITPKHKNNINGKIFLLEKEELYELMKTKSFIEIAKIYNVSDTCVRKIAKKYNLYLPNQRKIYAGRIVSEKTKQKISHTLTSHWINQQG